MTRVYVVRHAEAAPGEPDELRPLTAAGRDQAFALAAELAAARPDAVISSPLLRARETAAPIAEAAGLTVETDDRLAPGADAEAVRAIVLERGPVVVVVGHQPDCSEVVAELGGPADAPFPPGGVHALDLVP